MKRIAAFALVVMTLLASVQVRLSAHMCKGSIASFAVFTDVEGCGMTSGSMSCVQNKRKQGFSKIPCCADVQAFSLLSNFLSPLEHQDNEITDLVWSYFEVLQRTCDNTSISGLMPQEKPPPDDSSVRKQAKLQVFLI
jgi:hypothetical protein